MAKPKTMSDPMTIRVPLELWPLLEANAAKHDRTPAEHTQIRVIEALEAQEARNQPPRHLVEEAAESGCPHVDIKTFEHGLARCLECDAVRGVDNLWRAKT